MKLKLGDIVVPVPEKESCLHSSHYTYQFAVVIVEKPLVLVSQHADMKWTNSNPEDFDVIGTANIKLFDNCCRRLFS